MHSRRWKLNCSRGVSSCSPVSPRSKLRTKRSDIFLMPLVLLIYLCHLPALVTVLCFCFISCLLLCTAPQVKKTMEATLSTIQDMVTVEDYDVSECFHHSNSMESVKSTFSESYLSKPSLAKRRANQQETEQFYFTVSASYRCR